MIDFLYWYAVDEIISFYDSDTLTLRVNLGFNNTTKITVRLYGINAYEMKGVDSAKGKAARSALEKELKKEDGTYRRVIINSRIDKKEKYGRVLAVLYIQQDDGSYKNINEWLVDNGHAVPYMVDKD